MMFFSALDRRFQRVELSFEKNIILGQKRNIEEVAAKQPLLFARLVPVLMI